MSEHFHWRNRTIPFRPGESIAAALDAAGVRAFGMDALGRQTRYFCGIGACQGCLVRIDGVAREACLTPARPDIAVRPLEEPHE
ncbi:(2Fe-2S)-binding protein [Pseudomonas sp. R2.Fl]|nr:(2Fe-2S)-binding protein [Pseudomonas sp. R2.Fl]